MLLLRENVTPARVDRKVGALAASPVEGIVRRVGHQVLGTRRCASTRARRLARIHPSWMWKWPQNLLVLLLPPPPPPLLLLKLPPAPVDAVAT